MSSLRLHAPRSQTCFPFCQLTPPPACCSSSTAAFPALPQGPGPACGPFWEGPLCNLPFQSSCYWSLLRGEKVGEEEGGLGTRGVQTGRARMLSRDERDAVCRTPEWRRPSSAPRESVAPFPWPGLTGPQKWGPPSPSPAAPAPQQREPSLPPRHRTPLSPRLRRCARTSWGCSF